MTQAYRLIVYDLGRCIWRWQAYKTLGGVYDIGGCMWLGRASVLLPEIFGNPKEDYWLYLQHSYPISPNPCDLFNCSLIRHPRNHSVILLTFLSNSLKTAASEPTPNLYMTMIEAAQLSLQEAHVFALQSVQLSYGETHFLLIYA